MKERHLAVFYTHGSDKMKQFLNCQLDHGSAAASETDRLAGFLQVLKIAHEPRLIYAYF